MRHGAWSPSILTNEFDGTNETEKGNSMEIGTGIAIAGAWIFAGMLGVSKTVSGVGLWVGIIAAAIVTFALK